jgi:hypothetical protein
MISVIICSANPALLASLRKNIELTIGLPHEIIAIDNRAEQRGICEVYNEGAAMANYPFICFMHEDILFETNGWGRKIVDHLSDDCTGLLGIAGGDMKSRVPSSWSVPLVANAINLHQHYRFSDKAAERILVNKGAMLMNRKKAIALDGVLLCTKKEVFDHFRFDQDTFRRFHGYDIDFSLQVSSKYDVYVIYDVLIHHYSEGNPDRSWMESAILLSEKWRNLLPASIYPPNKHDYVIHHWQAMRVFVEKLFQLKYPRIRILQLFVRYSFNSYFSFRRFLSVGKFVAANLYA